MAVNAERMAIQEINDVGGLLGMKIVPVIADGESDPDVRIRFQISFHMFSLKSFLILSILLTFVLKFQIHPSSEVGAST